MLNRNYPESLLCEPVVPIVYYACLLHSFALFLKHFYWSLLVRFALYISYLFAYSKCTIILYSLLYVFLLSKTTHEGLTIRKPCNSLKVRSLSVLPVLLAISFSDHERIIPSSFLTIPSKICSSPKVLSQFRGQNLWSLGLVESSQRKSPLCQHQGNTTHRAFDPAKLQLTIRSSALEGNSPIMYYFYRFIPSSGGRSFISNIDLKY